MSDFIPWSEAYSRAREDASVVLERYIQENEGQYGTFRLNGDMLEMLTTKITCQGLRCSHEEIWVQSPMAFNYLSQSKWKIRENLLGFEEAIIAWTRGEIIGRRDHVIRFWNVYPLVVSKDDVWAKDWQIVE